MQTSISGADGPSSQPLWSQRQTLTAFALILAAWAIAVAIWPLTGSVVPWDSKNQFYPTLRYLGTALASGELPLWNPYHFGGHPSAADPQSLLFTPTMLLFGWLVPEPSMQAFDVVVFAHFLPGALAFIPLFRRRGWHPAGAVAAALVFMLGGSATARLQHTGMIFSYGFFPLAFWLLEEAMDRRSYRYGVLFALSAAMMVIGRDQVAFLCALTLIALAAQRVWCAPQPLAYLKSRLGLLLSMGLLGGALLAVPVVLTMQFLATSTRPSFGFGVAAMGSLPPESLATILFGNVFGSLRWTYDYWGPDWHSLSEGTWTDRATNYLFVGTIPALLFLWHGVAGGRLFAREFRFFLVLGLVALFYALGRYTPGFEVIFDHLPGVNLYRRPADATFVINIALAFAAGYLVHRYATDGLPKWSRASLGPLDAMLPLLAFGLLVAAVASALVFAIRGGHVSSGSDRDRHGTRGCSRRHRRDREDERIGPLAWGHGPGAGHAHRRGADRPPCGLRAERGAGGALHGLHQAAARAAPGPADPQAGACGAQRPRRVSARRDSRPQGRLAERVHGARDRGHHRLQPPAPRRLRARRSAPARTPKTPTCAGSRPASGAMNVELASLLGLDYIVLDRPARQLPRHFPRLTDAEVVYGTGRMWIYRLNTSVPRAYVAHHVTPVDSEAVLGQDEVPEFNRETEALIDDESMHSLKAAYTPAGADRSKAKGTARIVGYQRNSVALEVESGENGVLVLHDINYPGWEAWVDGERRPILRANLLFRGVEVGPGKHGLNFISARCL